MITRFFLELMTPETSETSENQRYGPVRPIGAYQARKSVIKPLFWVMVSIGMGLLAGRLH